MYFSSRVIGNFNAKAKSYSINFNLHKDMTATLAQVTVKPNGMQNLDKTHKKETHLKKNL